MLFDELDDKGDKSDSDLETGGSEEASIQNSASLFISLKDILSDLAKKIDLEGNKISKFNICRNDIWEGAKRELARKSFSPFNKISVKFSDDAGISEGAVDLGGLHVNFLPWSLNGLQVLSCSVAHQKGNFYLAVQAVLQTQTIFIQERLLHCL